MSQQQINFESGSSLFLTIWPIHYMFEIAEGQNIIFH
uniref:Uncharacterized protein n=1 Tax=Rhizophora mucronata TaxID=61149 RepID=A0A2P2PGE8_RHIMU